MALPKLFTRDPRKSTGITRLFRRLNVYARERKGDIALGGARPRASQVRCGFMGRPSLTRAFMIAYTVLKVPFHFSNLRDLGVGRASQVTTLVTRVHGLNCMLRRDRNSMLS